MYYHIYVINVFPCHQSTFFFNLLFTVVTTSCLQKRQMSMFLRIMPQFSALEAGNPTYKCYLSNKILSHALFI